MFLPAHNPKPPQKPTSGEVEPVTARGKFLFRDRIKFWIRGVTYGTFRPNGGDHDYPPLDIVDRDFTAMASHGINTVRTYTVPPRWLLDAAHRHSLGIMVGLPWEQHITFLDDARRARDIEERVRAGIRACAGHPAVIAYTIGNEIPAPIVRWYGYRKVERYLERLYNVAKAVDPATLVTYVNYPTTEYLRLPFLDFVCFNVYLESQKNLKAYLARLHNLAGDRPLVLAEIGLDSCRHGELAQGRALDWQVRTAFASGCAGSFVFAWTDEWHRGGYDVEDWDFGLTARDRRSKPALLTVTKAFQDAPISPHLRSPRISVVVCCYNEARVIRDCLEALQKVEYPNFEVIVVDDGSTDATASIAKEYDVSVISTPNRGLSNARNTGIEAATGEIVAFIDGDAYPDPHWLTYLGASFASSQHAGIGGPNLAPHDDGWIADCVANAPGNPTHVLVTDEEAEHIPGCNMAYRKACLEAVGGFDPRFRTAGDDVDLCWRLQEKGWTLGFHPSAMVWHHRRNSIRAYWKQQVGYGHAEAQLEKKWPDKYNTAGHRVWNGRLYGKGLTETLNWRPSRIYHGTWGSALFQSLYQPASNTFLSLTLMPEWYLVVSTLAVLSVLGTLWKPLLSTLPLLALAVLIPAGHACLSAAKATFTCAPQSTFGRLRSRGLTAIFHLIQPMARLRGRLKGGLTPWRRAAQEGFVFPRRRTFAVWSENWQAPNAWLQSLETAIRAQGMLVNRGGDFDRWDLQVQGGLLGATRLCMTLEEHGAGKQLLRFSIWPSFFALGYALLVLFSALCAGAVFDQAWAAGAILGVAAVVVGQCMFMQGAVAMASMVSAVNNLRPGHKDADGSAGEQLFPEPVENPAPPVHSTTTGVGIG